VNWSNVEWANLSTVDMSAQDSTQWSLYLESSVLVTDPLHSNIY